MEAYFGDSLPMETRSRIEALATICITGSWESLSHLEKVAHKSTYDLIRQVAAYGAYFDDVTLRFLSMARIPGKDSSSLHQAFFSSLMDVLSYTYH